MLVLRDHARLWTLLSVALLVGAVTCFACLATPSMADAQSYERHIERARDYYLEVEFDRALAELRLAVADRAITAYARREALMLMGTIQTAQGDLSAAARTFAEVRVRWPEFEPPRNVPPSARQVFSAVPQDEMDRVAREIGARGRRRTLDEPPTRDDARTRRRRRDRDERDDDRGGGGIPTAAWIGGGAVLLAAALVITVLVVTADDRATVVVRFTD